MTRLVNVGGGQYAVHRCGPWPVLLGWLTREHHRGTGARSLARYVGYVSPYSDWEWQPASDEGVLNFPSFKEARSYVLNL